MSSLKYQLGPNHDDETPEFKDFLEGSLEGLRLQTGAHQGTWQLGESDRWDFDQETGELVFTFPDKIVSAPAQIIGTFDGQNSSWMWAWANESIDPALARDSIRCRTYGEQHHIARLTTPAWPCEESEAWAMTAFANRLCESNGAYRGPAGTTLVFFTFGRVTLTGQA